jgi:hypothetical protein
MNYMWEIFEEIGYKVKDINYLIPNDEKLEKKYNESKLERNLKNVYVYNDNDTFYIINKGRTIKIFFNEQSHPHKSFFHKFVLDDDRNICNICYEKSEGKITCSCGYITCPPCFRKLKECAQCRKKIEILKNI